MPFAVSRSILRAQLSRSVAACTKATVGHPITSLLCAQQHQWMSSSAADIDNNNNTTDPSRFVTGVTQEDAEKDPVVKGFLRANFPDAFRADDAAYMEEKEEQAARNWGDVRRSIPKIALNIRPLHAYQRCAETEEGSRGSRRLRGNGFLPGILYGGNPVKGINYRDPSSDTLIKTPTSTVQSEWDRYRWHFESRVYDMTVFENEESQELGDPGTVHRVTPRDVQRHPVRDEMMYCVNFLRYFAGRPLQLPLVLINEEESPALKRDGFLIPINRFVECVVDDGVDIPEVLEVEATGLKFKEVIRMDRVIFPDGVRPSKRLVKRNKVHPFIIGPIHGGRSLDDEEGEGAGENEEEE